MVKKLTTVMLLSSTLLTGCAPIPLATLGPNGFHLASENYCAPSIPVLQNVGDPKPTCPIQFPKLADGTLGTITGVENHVDAPHGGNATGIIFGGPLALPLSLASGVIAGATNAIQDPNKGVKYMDKVYIETNDTHQVGIFFYREGNNPTVGERVIFNNGLAALSPTAPVSQQVSGSN
jgi:hypothetical protein